MPETPDYRALDSRKLDESYAPRELTLDPGALGLTESRVSSSLGTVVAWSLRTNRSPRATIFLHGAAGSWTTWTPMLTLAADTGVAIPNPILLDLPGWGAATLTPDGESAVLEAVCSLIRSAAEDLGFTEWDLVGHSMGGFIAMHMAAVWPEFVLSVGTVSGTGWAVIDAVDHPVRRFWTLPGFVLLSRAFALLAALGPAGPALVRGLRSLGLLRAATSPLFRHARAVPDSVIFALADELRPRAFTCATAIARAYGASSVWATVECPVRAVIGDRDVFARESDLAGLAAILPGSTSAVLADCGHFGLIERPAAVLRGLGFAA